MPPKCLVQMRKITRHNCCEGHKHDATNAYQQLQLRSGNECYRHMLGSLTYNRIHMLPVFAHLWLLRVFSISVMLFSMFGELTVSTFASLKTSFQSWMVLSAGVLVVPGARSGQGNPAQCVYMSGHTELQLLCLQLPFCFNNPGTQCTPATHDSLACTLQSRVCNLPAGACGRQRCYQRALQRM